MQYWLINKSEAGKAMETVGPFDSVNWARAALQKAKEYWQKVGGLDVADRHFLSDARPDESELPIESEVETPLSPDNRDGEPHDSNCYCRPCCGQEE